jgi:hypothetical protein
VKAYKILTLIGSVLGLIITVGALGMVGFLIMGFGLDTDYQFVGLAISSSVFYIVALCVIFGIRNTRVSGIILIISAVFVLIISRFYGILGFILLSNFYGILGFALLLAAGIISLREKKTRLGSVTKVNP